MRPSLTVRSVCVLGSVLWIPVQVEQHHDLNRIKGSGAYAQRAGLRAKGRGIKVGDGTLRQRSLSILSASAMLTPDKTRREEREDREVRDSPGV